jgi:hypothetical protein
MNRTILNHRLVATFIDAVDNFIYVNNILNNMFSIQIATQEKQQWRNISDYFYEGTFSGEIAVQAILNFDTYHLVLSYTTEDYTLDIKLFFEGSNIKTQYSFEELNNVLAPDDFHCYTITELISEEKVKQAFEWVIYLFSEARNNIEIISTAESSLRYWQKTAELIKLFWSSAIKVI